ncbi:MAG TPA: retropepsin-like aspartic protease [Thermoanaerobaculia bacterium]|nr:retropepsin-like aspartic protease [Thermoanaerobaculia bacterium]
MLRIVLASVLLLGSVDAQRDGKLLFVPVRVAGHGPYWFAVDSGAPHSVIDPFIVKELGLTTTAAPPIKGTGQGDVAVQKAPPLEMSIGKVKLRVEEPWVIDLSGVPIPKTTHGLLGADFFERFVVEIDHERSTVRFFDPRTFRPPKDAVALPLEDTNHRLFLNVTIDVNDKERVERRVRIDTGSSDAVGDEAAKRARVVQQSTLGQGLGSDYQSVSGRFDAVHLGPFTFRPSWGPATPFPCMGMEMLRRFTATFDVAHGTLYLRPNRHLKEPVPPPGG